MPLRLVSLNIEWDRHLDTVLPFLSAFRPDVACLQELFDADIPKFEAALNARCFFTPAIRHATSRGDATEGVGIFSSLPMRDTSARQYAGPAELQTYEDSFAAWSSGREKRSLSAATVEKDGAAYRILTTHFTWTADGMPNEMQLKDFAALRELLSSEPSFVLCGDLNAPRGGVVFGALAEKYTDGIPEEYGTSIDVSLHRLGKEKAGELSNKMVDCLFAAGGYRTEDARLVFGVSDHAAVTASIHTA